MSWLKKLYRPPVPDELLEDIWCMKKYESALIDMITKEYITQIERDELFVEIKKVRVWINEKNKVIPDNII